MLASKRITPMKIKSFSNFNNGVGQNTLARPTVIEKCISKHSRIEHIPLKRSFYDMYSEGKALHKLFL